jgi:Arc/MetJ-type ribon-helix-helix transcriptional regulator
VDRNASSVLAINLVFERHHAISSGVWRRYLTRVVGGMMIHPTAMPKTKVALTLDSALLDQVDRLVATGRFPNRSQAVGAALAEKLARLARTRLAEECAKLDPAEEQRLAADTFGADVAWPEY